ncbi:MAG TPA: hypothetical protein VKE95_18060 [Burkholderiales bacterium]|nr:hypothetical protein [Burkholderiales bacterium]
MEAVRTIMGALHDMDSDVGNDQASRARHIRETATGVERLTDL